MSFIEQVRAKRQKLADVLVDEEYSGLRQFVEELYPDKAHFLYELLQNAEDTGAGIVQFRLEKNRLVFAHDGRPFTDDDVWGITNIGKGTKRDDEDKIGRFGVGFKAVFAYSETPSIWSPTHNFKICDLVLPTEIKPRTAKDNATVFDFPFNNPKKSAEAAFDEIAEGLQSLSEELLIFLSHIHRVRWEIVGGAEGGLKRIDRPPHLIEVQKKVGGKVLASSSFLRFKKSVDGLPSQNVSVAFPLEAKDSEKPLQESDPISDVFRVVPGAPARVSVYFPAEKEVSGLRFHVHAPFVPELSRASIKDTPANDPLFQQLAGMMPDVLEQIRGLGLLTVEFLNVLPHSQDGVPAKYQPIRDAIIGAMNSSPLTPTQSKKHLPATQLFQAKAALKDLLPSEDLRQVLEDDTAFDWAVAAPQRNSNADRFLGSLEIKRWDVDRFVSLLERRKGDDEYWDQRTYRYKISEPNEEFDAWFASKDATWLQRLYAMLHRELGENGGLDRFKSIQIVRLTDQSFARPDRSFFSRNGMAIDDRFPRVDSQVYEGGKSKSDQDAAKKFLEAAGVREVGEREQVEAILNSTYVGKNEIAFDDHVKDLNRFLQLIHSDPNAVKLFVKRLILLDEHGKRSSPSDIYLDEPFVSTGLSAFYNAFDTGEGRHALSPRYAEVRSHREFICEFAEAVGALSRLQVCQVSCDRNPNVGYLVHQAPGNPSRHKIDKDYQIHGLVNALKNPSVPLARLIWSTLARQTDIKWTRAIYRSNQTQQLREDVSQLVVTLRDAKWLPQGDEFVRPAEADFRLLPEDFEYAPGWKWLAAIKFGENVTKRTEEYKKKKEFAAELGFDDDQSLEDAKWFAALDAEARQLFKSEYRSRMSVDLPERSSANPERRSDKVGQLALDAPEEEKEVRSRSVSTVIASVKKEIKPYLREQYTNADGVMFCQICQAGVPFSLANGEPYFETVQLVPKTEKLFFQNYLALCPNHAAMVQLANDSKDAIAEQFATLDGDRLPIVLAGKSLHVYFTETHRKDLQAVIKSTGQSETSEDQ
ncbi:hypothetical protein FHS27_001205 [Rhodopirellula rubra]|uniref:Sacsin/Nov domain-containing protein n=1 Tax=Aporhodopirellula rubra TaxID=980271 RepID=A0A7W5H4Y7_9BACT|nr:hypothetical protein [Aporhodopirellula rubra]MBB3205405.1 hypothetical protein [Aporhodopirellula rubra]